MYSSFEFELLLFVTYAAEKCSLPSCRLFWCDRSRVLAVEAGVLLSPAVTELLRLGHDLVGFSTQILDEPRLVIHPYKWAMPKDRNMSSIFCQEGLLFGLFNEQKTIFFVFGWDYGFLKLERLLEYDSCSSWYAIFMCGCFFSLPTISAFVSFKSLTENLNAAA